MVLGKLMIVNKFEKIMKNIFELKYKLRNDIGIEYFEGDLKDMLNNN
jgi:hypothetical protein